MRCILIHDGDLAMISTLKQSLTYERFAVDTALPQLDGYALARAHDIVEVGVQRLGRPRARAGASRRIATLRGRGYGREA